MSSHRKYNREYRNGAIYRITINLSDESCGGDGTVRAAREMATIATRQQGFISLNTIETGGITTSYMLLLASLEAIDIWRSRIYESALNRYGQAAWKTFENTNLDTIDVARHNPIRSVRDKVRNVFSLAKNG